MRLDRYLSECLGVATRSKAQNLIKIGRVRINGRIADKAGEDVEGKTVELLKDMEYPSMGGYKLKKAFEDFGLTADGLTACDVGASNGGFTSVLLEYGAKKVYSIDVGECALSDSLKNDSRVCVLDRTNARTLKKTDFFEDIDMAVADVSFISLKTILPNIYDILRPSGQAVLLVKPQFEVGSAHLNKKGIVTDRKTALRALRDVIDAACSCGFTCFSDTEAPIYENKNIEYLIYLIKNGIN